MGFFQLCFMILLQLPCHKNALILYCSLNYKRDVMKHKCKYTPCYKMVGKQSLWYLSLVYMSYVSVPVRTALKFRKQTMSFEFCNLKFGTYTIICSIKLLSFGINYFSIIIFGLFRTLMESLGIS